MSERPPESPHDTPDEQERPPEEQAHPPEGHEHPAEGHEHDHDRQEPISHRGEQPTEEMFALEARLEAGEDLPELDPLFKAALLEETGHHEEVPDQGADGSDTGEHAAEPGESDEHEAVDGTGEHEVDEQEHGETDEHEAGPGETGETGEYTDEHTDERDYYDPITDRTAVLASRARREVHEAIAAARDGGVPWEPTRPPLIGDPEPPPRRPRFWWRFLLATVIIVLSFAGATSASIIFAVKDLANAVGNGRSIPHLHIPPSTSGPQTILILGSDKRAGEGDAGRSDTALLLRLDPDKKLVSMISIPRDLKVDIPGYGVDKFNAAYTDGGPALTVDTIKQLTGIVPNHVINVDFQGFAEAVDAIHCVFVDVDRKYYHSNVGLPPSAQYSEIDIDAGYQKLCGEDALAYVRYRHTDTDLVRSARQQEFLRDARGMVPPANLWSERDQLIKIIDKYTTVDPGLKQVSTLLDMAKLLYALRGSDVNKVEFPVTLGPSYVYSNPTRIHNAVEKFLDGDSATQAKADSSTNSPSAGQAGGSAKSKSKSKKAKPKSGSKPKKRAELVDAADGGKDVADDLADETGHGFPVFYPTQLPPGSIYAQGSRVYHLRDTDKNAHAAYRIVVQLQTPESLEYFGVQGIHGWTDPPILAPDSQKVTMDGRDYQVYTEGGRVRLISWTDGDNVYWISNTLTQNLDNPTMLGMARSVAEVIPPRKSGKDLGAGAQ